MCQRASGVFGVFHPSYSPTFTSRFHSWACALLCCVYFQELEQGYLSWKSAALPPYSPLLTCLILPYDVLLPIILVCYYQWSLVGFIVIWLSVFETHTLEPCLLGFYRPPLLNQDNVLKLWDFLWNNHSVYHQASRNAGLRGFCKTGCGNMQQLVQNIRTQYTGPWILL